MANLSQLPPPPSGQRGMTLDQLGVPPTGQKGQTLEQILAQQQPDKSFGFAGTKFLGENLGLLSETKPLMQTSKTGTALQDTINQRVTSGKTTPERAQQLSQGLQPDINQVVPQRSTGDIVRGGIKAGLDIGSLVIGGGGASGIAEATVGGAIKQGALQGLKAGALSGGMSGLGQGIEENQGVGNTVGQTFKGAAIGGGTGAAIGAVAPAISAGIQRLKNGPAHEDLIKEALSVTQPPMNKKSAVNALQRAGLSGGAEETGKLKNVGVSTSSKDQRVAESVAGIVKKGASPIKNNTAINKEITRISENEVLPGLEAHPAPFNTNQIRARLNKIEMPTLFKTDPQLEKTYQLVKDTALKEIQKQPQNTAGLWNARKSIDEAVQKQFGAAIFNPEKSSAIKQAVSDVRQVMNGYIAETHPEFATQMNKLTNMYEARNRIANVNYKDITQNLNRVTRWVKDNPTKAKALGLTVGGALIGKYYHLLF